MSGKRLLDAAAIFNASRAIARKHVTLRQHQWDTYSRTSTLAKAVKSQTDRVTLTLKAASVLAERLNESGAAYSTKTNPSGTAGIKEGIEQDHFYTATVGNAEQKPSVQEETHVRQDSAEAPPFPDGSTPFRSSPDAVPAQDTESYSAPPKSTPPARPLTDEKPEGATGLAPKESGRSSIPIPESSSSQSSSHQARVQQRQSEQQIPSQAAEPPAASTSSIGENKSSESSEQEFKISQEQDVFYEPPKSSSQVLSALPRVKLPKNTEDVQESDEHVPDGQINQDVFYSSRPVQSEHVQSQTLPHSQAVPEQEDLPDQTYSELFHSPKVSKLLRGQPNPQQPTKGMQLEGAEALQIPQAKSSQDKDFVSTSTRSVSDSDPGASSKLGSAKGSERPIDEDVQSLAADIAHESQAADSEKSSVCALDPKNGEILID